MAATREDLPENIDALKAVLLVERARAVRVEAELAVAKAKASDDDALIAHQRLQIEKLTRQLYGQHSERTARLIDQMELAFEELESSASEDEIAAARCGQDHQCGGLHPQAPGAPALPRAPAARAGGRAGTRRLPVLRQRATA